MKRISGKDLRDLLAETPSPGGRRKRTRSAAQETERMNKNRVGTGEICNSQLFGDHVERRLTRSSAKEHDSSGDDGKRGCRDLGRELDDTSEDDDQGTGEDGSLHSHGEDGDSMEGGVDDDGVAKSNSHRRGQEGDEDDVSFHQGGDLSEGGEDDGQESLSQQEEDSVLGDNGGEDRAPSIIQTIVGPVCTKAGCMCRINSSRFFVADRGTISRHCKSKKCGSHSTESYEELMSRLRLRMKSLHESAVGNRDVAYRDFQGDKFCDSWLAWYCPLCGYNDKKRKRVKRHIGGKRSQCKGEAEEKGRVIENIWGFVVPDQLLQNIVAGKSPLEKFDKTIKLSLTTGETAAGGDAIVQQPEVQGTLPSATTATPSKRGSIIAASPGQMERITSPNYVARNIQMKRLVEEQLQQLDEVGAEGHAKTFLHLAEHGNFIEVVRELALKQQPQYDSGRDEVELGILRNAGKKWIESGAANLDVAAVGAKIRCALYHVGDGAGDNDGDLAQVKSFSETKDTTALLKEFNYLLQFLYRSNWEGLSRHREQVLQVHNGMLESEGDEEKAYQHAVDCIVDTCIVSGLILTAALEDPQLANGPNIIADHLAARSVKLVGDANDVELRSPNEISRGANLLLRLVRHAACSHLNNHAKEMRDKGVEHSEFEKYAESLIRDVRKSRSIESICTRIRTARDIDRKRPTKISKMIDPDTGDISIGGKEIKYIHWKRCIPRSLEIVDNILRELFTAHDLLDKLFDVKNPLVFSGPSSYVVESLPGGQENKVSLDDIRPCLHASDGIREKVNKCFAFEKFAMGYLGVGAGRGTELERIPEFSECDLIFNTLHYQMCSEKGENHAQYKNKMANHYLPPSVARRIALINICLYSAAESTDGLSIPDPKNASRHANEMFQRVMQLQNPLGPKNNRQAVASMCNFILPDSSGKLSTRSDVARFMHHSSAVHDQFYSDEIIGRDGDGRIIGSELLIARKIWRGMGECNESFPKAGCLERGPMGEHMLDSAAQTMFNNRYANVVGTQREAIIHAGDASVKRHAVVVMGMGHGKSGIYNILLAARALDGRKCDRTLVISPHNSLMAQHASQSEHYLGRHKVKVCKLENVPENAPPEDPGNFDLLFVTIHSFSKIMEHHKDVVIGWQVKTIFVDEVHNILGEFFRFRDSWKSLGDLVALQAKIICMTATANKIMVDSIARFLGMENFDVIGDIRTISLPRVCLLVNHATTDEEAKRLAVEKVVSDFKDIAGHNFSSHVIVRKKEDAQRIAGNLERKGIKRVAWLTSDSSSHDRESIMKKWSGRGLDALVSTIQDGIDCSSCKRVYLVGGSHSVVSLLQGAGRIRPPQQGDDAIVYIFDKRASSAQQAPLGNNDADLVSTVGAMKELGLVPPGDEGMGGFQRMYESLFHQHGYLSLVRSKECYMKGIGKQFGTNVPDCGKCTNCQQGNGIVMDAQQAQERRYVCSEHEKYVLSRLDGLEEACYVCKNRSCNGEDCLKAKYRNYCFGCYQQGHYGRCFAKDPQQNNRVICPGSICGRCFVPFSLPRAGVTHRSGGQGECSFSGRVKRILLYKSSALRDKGKVAGATFKACGASPDSWFRIMSENMKKIDTDDGERRAT